MDQIHLSGYDVIFVPIIMAIAQMLRMAKVPERFIPFTELVMGVIAGIFYFDLDLKHGILVGIWLGLASTGLLTGYKISMAKPIEPPKPPQS